MAASKTELFERMIVAILMQQRDITILTRLALDPTTESLPTCRYNARQGLDAHQQESERRLIILNLLLEGKVAVAKAEADWSLDPMHARTLGTWATAVSATCEREKAVAK
ncbi:hypothetical protein FJY94_03200 [Candidatus Kaiserbacteria bacterium]|nr:hypothetical protein [Candidatus Kaiserbacteria bacterium]